MAIDFTNAAYVIWQDRQTKDYNFVLQSRPQIKPIYTQKTYNTTIGNRRNFIQTEETYDMVEITATFSYVYDRVVDQSTAPYSVEGTDAYFRKHLYEMFNASPSQKQHEGKLIFSDDTTKYYEAVIANIEIDNNDTSSHYRQFTVTWEAQPFVSLFYPVTLMPQDAWEVPYFEGKEILLGQSSPTTLFDYTPVAAMTDNFDFGAWIYINSDLMDEWDASEITGKYLHFTFQSIPDGLSYYDNIIGTSVAENVGNEKKIYQVEVKLNLASIYVSLTSYYPNISAWLLNYDCLTGRLSAYEAPEQVTPTYPVNQLYPQSDVKMILYEEDDFFEIGTKKYLKLNYNMTCTLANTTATLYDFCTCNISTSSANTFKVTCDHSEYEQTSYFCEFYPYIRRIEEV